MQLNEIKRIITDQQEQRVDFFQKEKLIERELSSDKLKKFVRHPNIVVISGVRRSGKSTLAHLLLKNEKYGAVNFDDERLVGFTHQDFDLLMQAFFELYGSLEYFIFDEIQNVLHWELFLTRLRQTKKIIITGSNANLLSSELATHLTGRYVDFVLYPFSFKEYLSFIDLPLQRPDLYSTIKTGRVKKAFLQYFNLGGFPEALKFGTAIVNKIYGDILDKDIVIRHQIRNRKTFKELARYLVSNFSQPISFSKLPSIFAIKNVHTVRNYWSYLTESFLVFILEQFSYKLKQQIIGIKKTYTIDTGLINAVGFQFSPNTGRLLENLVFLELLRKKSYGNETMEVYFWKDYLGHEVDFVIKEQKNITKLIQVTQTVADQKTRERELRSLLRAGRELHCKKLLVLTDEVEKEERIKEYSVKFIPLWKWLLD